MVLSTLSGDRLIELIPARDQILGDLGIVGRRLAADPDMAAVAPRALDRLPSNASTPGSRSSKSKATSSLSRSTPSISWVRSFEPIEKPSKRSAKRVDQDDVVRDLAHHVDLEPVLAAPQPLLRHHRQHLVGLLEPPAERHHELEVGEAHLLAHAAHRGAFEARSRRDRQGGRSARRRGTRASGSPRAARNRGRRAGPRTRSILKSDSRTITGLGQNAAAIVPTPSDSRSTKNVGRLG